MFATPETRILAQNREFKRILRQNPSTALAVASCKNPPPKKKKLTLFGVQFGVESHTCAETKPLGES